MTSLTQERSKSQLAGRGSLMNKAANSKLLARGIFEVAQLAGWQEYRYYGVQGWRYPVLDLDGVTLAYRWKNSTSEDKKYVWPAGKGSACYYIPDIKNFIQAIERSDGTLWLANGEPAALAFVAAGFSNVVSWFGERSLPKTLAADLAGWGVRQVYYPADHDDTGHESAAKVRDALMDSGIEFKPLAWPDDAFEKYDANDLWIECDFQPEVFRERLDSLPALILRREEREPERTYDTPPDETDPGLIGLLAQRLGVSGRRVNNEGFTMGKRIANPIDPHPHDAKNPASVFNLTTGVLYDHRQDESYGPFRLAEHFGIDLTPYRRANSHSNSLSFVDSESICQRLTDTPADIFAAGLPDSWRKALLNYFSKSTAPVMELIIAASRAGYINRAEFTRPDLKAANVALGFGLSDSLIDRTVRALEGVFLSKLDTVLGDLYMSNFDKNSGRRRETYGLKPTSEIKRVILQWATPRIIEKYGQTDGDNVALAHFTPDMLAALDVKEAAAPEVTSALNDALAPAFDAQGDMGKKARRKIYKALNALNFDLDNPQSTPIPTDDWLRQAGYRAAFLRATVAANPDERRSRATIAATIGMVRGSVTKIIRHAGCQQSEPQFEEQPVTDPVNLAGQVRRFAGSVQGYPRQVVIKAPNGVISEHIYTDEDAPDQIARRLQAGCKVSIRHQIANKQTVVMDAPLPKRERQPITVDMPAPVSALKTQIVTPAQPVEPKAFYGPSHDPRWVKAQLRLGLKLLGWIEDGGRLIDPDTGENAPDEPLAIVELLTGIQLTQPKIFKEGAWWIQSYPALERVNDGHR